MIVINLLVVLIFVLLLMIVIVTLEARLSSVRGFMFGNAESLFFRMLEVMSSMRKMNDSKRH